MIIMNIVIDTKLSSFKHFLSSFLSEFHNFILTNIETKEEGKRANPTDETFYSRRI